MGSINCTINFVVWYKTRALRYHVQLETDDYAFPRRCYFRHSGPAVVWRVAKGSPPPRQIRHSASAIRRVVRALKRSTGKCVRQRRRHYRIGKNAAAAAHITMSRASILYILRRVWQPAAALKLR